MRRKPVESSLLGSVGYDAVRCVLEVELQNGRVYRYTGVPREEYEALFSAPSRGSCFDAHVRDGYPYRQVR